MKKNKFSTLGAYLHWYYTNCQKNIGLVYRGDVEENWAKRCQYLDPQYQPLLKYNHRSVLDCEVIIEYDQDNPHLNELLANKVIKKLMSNKISYAKWFSGNKSSHVHVLLRVDKAKNLSLLKKTFMKQFGTFYLHEESGQLFDKLDDVPQGTVKRIVPDLQLSGAHLIRAEFGLHEKTQFNKELKGSSSNYPSISVIPQFVWDAYEDAQKFSVSVRMGQQTKDLAESALVKELLDTVQFKENMDDGRERLMFILTHVLKHKYRCWEDLADFLFSWYSYSGGKQLDEDKVRNKVKYHYFRNYSSANWERIIKDLLDELIGREKLTVQKTL